MPKVCLKCGKINDDLVTWCIECKSGDFKAIEVKKKQKKRSSLIGIVGIIFIILSFVSLYAYSEGGNDPFLNIKFLISSIGMFNAGISCLILSAINKIDNKQI